ncbi:HTH-type transcriptional repressor YtrA [Clostridiales bacterium CHKCI006]|uniref:GntR family transcriptional regulator n=1 Tax=Candidatus Fimiplasma intestinipullorum TaxID=2840825 RepID=A0A9D1HQZ7_9FIRM|nr:HTH-type transcriptional repressor YtrA [Clostridiales bacterium CHKCI006]HIU13894.1 GntR family transcriptional regulator [Candidatus Fimiplasma intestinipullorum]
MHIIINNSSQQPIYEQIVESIKAMIMSGELGEDTMLPSVRALARDLKISALTVKKAYDHLESEGFIVTVHGKGSFVAMANANLLAEQARKEVEADLERAIQKGRRCGMTDEEISDLVRLLMEDSIC